MRICPNCGRENTGSTELCEACTTHVSSRRKHRNYLVSILALAALILVALFTHLYFQSHFVRPPSDFLPSSTIFAVGTDLRPAGAAARRLRETWPQSDIDHLSRRATQIAQEFVYWTGLQLDLEHEASAWLGREIIVAALARADRSSGVPPTFMLIARVTNPRRARTSLDRAVEPIARAGGWARSVIRHNECSIILWSKPSQGPTLAYAIHEGCLLVAPDDSFIQQCLAAAADPTQRLTSTREFAGALSALPPDSLIWCYGSVPPLQRHLYEALPHLRKGWFDLLQYYRRGMPLAPPLRGPTPSPAQAGSGVFSLALTPEPNGIRVTGSHRRTETRESGPPPEWSALAEFLPREAIAYAFIHEPLRWLALVDSFLPRPRPHERSPHRASRVRALLPLVMASLGIEETPPDMLLVLLPRDEQQRPALLVALPNPEPEAAPRRIPSPMFPLVKDQIGEILIVATDQEALTQCRRAAADPDNLLAPDLDPSAQLQAWARPAQISPALASLEELQLDLRDNLEGGQGELALRVSPRDLLGGD